MRYVPQGQAEYTCEFQIKDKTGVFRTREMRVPFPTSEVHPTGAERGYIYRGYAGREVVVLARCTIPATDAALARMNRWFKVSSKQQAQQPAPTHMSNLGTGDCCTLPTVVVTGCQYGGLSYEDGGCNSPSQPIEDYTNCYYFGECGGGGGGGGTGSGGGGGPSQPPTVTPYEQGPVAFAICVLGALGSLAAFDAVAGSFSEWWSARQEYDSARRMLDMIYANPDYLEPGAKGLWEYRVEQAKLRMDAAIGAVRSATGVSFITLGTAATACGVAIVLPTI
ncbi:hypothetical protein [Longimicrobium terrae]|uniref:Uncharacterized protein n=1 Tax=Longimicrobium terrae TaxID=1639882 RepID=A0A841H5H4_9BACT|nr:hypothetical protein [Longimicrobium terrae]MBB4638897.1 hypothetical protein [Longimicrobium terrae]MBB6073136.1 hypothetical protein [Longimicrobium terrae]NNC30177.1 hypothetical protein [Longimicrobium terrae]